MKSFEVGKLTLGQAARLAELSRRAFLEILGRYKVPVFNYSPEDLQRERHPSCAPFGLRPAVGYDIGSGPRDPTFTPG